LQAALEIGSANAGARILVDAAVALFAVAQRLISAMTLYETVAWRA